MENRKPTYTTRELNSIIKDCIVLNELDRVKSLLLEEINYYEPSDQAFLFFTLGISMMRVTDAEQGSWVIDRLTKYNQKEPY